MPLTSWKSLDSQGHIADLPCTCFGYKYTISDFVPLLSVGVGGGIIYLRLAVHVEGPGGGVLFRQVVSTPVGIMSVGIPGMQMYAWWSGTPTILTTVCGTALPSGTLAAPISAEEGQVAELSNVSGIWPDEGAAVIGPADKGPFERVEFVREGDRLILVHRGVYDGGHPHAAGEIVVLAPPTISAEQGVLYPGGSSDYTDFGIYLMTEWQSPIYKLHLPAGSTFHIDFHNCGTAALRKSIAAVQTQVCRGGVRRPWLYIPEHGMWLTAETEEGRTVVRGACNPAALEVETLNTRFADIFGTTLIQGTMPELENTVLLRSSPASMRLLAVGERAGTLYVTDNDIEGDFNRWQEPMKLGESMTLLGVCTDRDGQLYCLVQDGGGTVRLLVHQLHYDSSIHRMVLGRTMTITPCIRRLNEDGTVQLVPLAGLTAQLHELRWQEGRLDLVADASGEQHLYTSTDGGQTWEE